MTHAATEIPGFEGEDENAIDYSFFCNLDMRAFSMISTAGLVYFTPELTSVPTAEGQVQNNLSCEGPIPGNGFGCRALGSSNTVTANQVIPGQLITTKDPCPEFKGQDAPKFWITATTTQLTATGTPFQTSSQPFRLKNSIDCPKPKPKPSKGKPGSGGGDKGGRKDS